MRLIPYYQIDSRVNEINRFVVKENIDDFWKHIHKEALLSRVNKITQLMKQDKITKLDEEFLKSWKEIFKEEMI